MATTESPVPTLDHDVMMKARYDHDVTPNGRLERRIVWRLFEHMARAGWTPSMVDDGDSRTPVSDAKSAMELIFNLDDVRVALSKEGDTHWIYLVLGNGVDLLCNWGYARDDSDGFNATIEAFDAWEHA